MHNLGTVFRFEVIRTLKKKSFWIMALGFPVMIGAIFGIIFFSNKSTDEAFNQAKEQRFKVAITDESRLITPALIKQIGAKTISNKHEGIDAVKKGAFDAYFFYPSNVKAQKVEVYGKDVGIFNNGRYEAVATSLLESSVSSAVSEQVRIVLQDNVSYSSNTYKDGVPYDATKQLIAPGIFLILFYLLIAFFGSQMLTSTTEEKENRVIEMILTTIEARTLIVGKITSLIALGFLQMLIVLAPAIIGYIFLHDRLALPDFDLSNIPIDWTRVGIGFAIFVASYALFTGLLVAIGAATPTAKEASGFFGIVMMLIFGPLYAAPLFISSPNSLLVQILSFFPFTAPIPLMLRNAVGNLSIQDAILAIIILAVAAIIIMQIAVRIFRYGALEYNRKLGFKEIFVRR